MQSSSIIGPDMNMNERPCTAGGVRVWTLIVDVKHKGREHEDCSNSLKDIDVDVSSCTIRRDVIDEIG
jgi:hypothetical protein